MKNIIKEIKKHTNHVKSPPRSREGGGATATTTVAAAATSPGAANESSPLLAATNNSSNNNNNNNNSKAPAQMTTTAPAAIFWSRMEEGIGVEDNGNTGSNKRTVTFDPNTTNNIPPPPKETNNNSNNNKSSSSAAASASSYGFSGYNKRDVECDHLDNHMAVMLQIHGSVWPHVFPWCIITVLWTCLVIWLKRNEYVDLTITSSTGHNFMSILVSFLVVTRATITYNRFMEALQHLTDLFQASRELIHYTCLLTNQNTNTAAQEWRGKVAYQTIVTIRVAIAAVEYRSHGINIWDTVLMDHDDYQSTEFMMSPPQQKQNGISRRKTSTTTTTAMNDKAAPAPTAAASARSEQIALHSLRHGPRTLTDEHFRAPIVWAYNLRETILQPRRDGRILAQCNWHANESLKLLAIVSDFVHAFHGLKKLVTTPFPFPLVQMTRTFLFAWVFTLPLVLIGENDSIIEVLVLTFFCTYGFLGLEYVNMELDDPYGDDPNDFPVRRWAEQVFEDIYIAIYKTDGYDSAMRLRSRVTEPTTRGTTVWDNN